VQQINGCAPTYKGRSDAKHNHQAIDNRSADIEATECHAIRHPQPTAQQPVTGMSKPTTTDPNTTQWLKERETYQEQERADGGDESLPYDVMR
jgi:hypothetical protein